LTSFGFFLQVGKNLWFSRYSCYAFDTHLDGFPSKVRILRERHPLQGQSLEVLGWAQRNESLHLTLVLPDGTRSFIPAQWTDLEISRKFLYHRDDD
jgi:hypothetical protein